MLTVEKKVIHTEQLPSEGTSQQGENPLIYTVKHRRKWNYVLERTYM